MYLQQTKLEDLWWPLSFVVLMLVLTPSRNTEIGHALLLSSWGIAAIWPQGRRAIGRMIRANRELTIVSMAMSLWIALGGIHRGSFLGDQIYSMMAPIAWIPAAALASAHLHANQRRLSIYATGLPLIILATAFILLLQYQQGNDRPNGFSFNVLTGPLLLIFLSLYIADVKHINNKKAIYIVFTTTVIGCMATQSRLALICFIGSSIASFITANAPSTRKRIVIISTIIATAWAILLSRKLTQFSKDIDTYQAGSYSSSSGDRIDAITWGINHLFDHPWLGYGKTQLMIEFNNRWIEWNRPEDSITKILHLHNDYIQIPLSYGWPCLVLQAAFWLLICIKINSRCPNTGTRIAGWVTGTIIGTASTSDSFAYWSNIWAACYACGGLLIALSVRQTREHPNPITTEYFTKNEKNEH